MDRRIASGGPNYGIRRTKHFLANRRETCQSKGQMDASDAAVVALAKSGDGDAFRVLVERHSRKLFRLAYRLTGDEQDAEDIVQETFLRAYRNLSLFDERAGFGTWLFRIASNYSVDLLRARQARLSRSVPVHHDSSEDSPGVEVVAEAPLPDRLAFSGQIHERLQQALTELSPRERTAFALRHFEGHTIEEISGMLKIGINATKHSIFRAVQKLRRALEPAGGNAAWRT